MKSWYQGIDFLQSMGYSAREARNALQVTQGNLHRAAELLVESHQLAECASHHQDDFNGVVEEPPSLGLRGNHKTKKSATSSMLSLTSLRDPLLIHILRYVSTVPDFGRCAQTCRRFHRLLQDDDLWKYCKGKWTNAMGSNRERALQHFEVKCLPPLKQIELHQTGTHFQNKQTKINLEWNYLLQVLQEQGWRDLISKVMALPTINFPCNDPGDNFNLSTLLALAHLVESNFVEFLEGVLQICIHRVKDRHNKEPAIRDDDVELGCHLMWYTNSRTRLTFQRILHLGDRTVDTLRIQVRKAIQKMLPEDSKTRLVHHLLRLAGIGAWEDSATHAIWEHLVVLLGALLKEATILHLDLPQGACFEHYLASLQPSETESAADRLRFRHCRVFGIPEIDDQVEYCEELDDDESEDCNTLSDDGDSSDGYFSIHSDKDCPDEYVGSTFDDEDVDDKSNRPLVVDATAYIFKTKTCEPKSGSQSPTSSTESGTH